MGISRLPNKEHPLLKLLKQSTAKTIKVLMQSSTDASRQTGLSVAQADIRLSKDGADFAQTSNAAGGTHNENGYYSIPLSTTDTNTLGTLIVDVVKSGSLPTPMTFEVVTAAIYDAFVAGSANLGVDVVAISGDAGAADNAEAAFDGTGFNVGNGAIVSASVTGNIGGSVASVVGAVGSVTGNVGGSVASVDGNVGGSVGSVVGNVGGDVIGSVGALGAQAVVDVNGAVDSAIMDASLPSGDAIDTIVTTATSTLATASALSTFESSATTTLSAIDSKTTNLPASPAATGDAMTLANSEDVYHARVVYTVDDANSQDEYIVTFARNAMAFDGTLTSPTLTVVTTDGTVLIDEATLTAVSGLVGVYKYVASSGERLSAGDQGSAQPAATFDGTAKALLPTTVSRDSAA
jgi:hypothetical protein